MKNLDKSTYDSDADTNMSMSLTVGMKDAIFHGLNFVWENPNNAVEAEGGPCFVKPEAHYCRNHTGTHV